jgi:hypothetical protein
LPMRPLFPEGAPATEDAEEEREFNLCSEGECDCFTTLPRPHCWKGLEELIDAEQ